MGILVPEDFDLRRLKNEAERAVVIACRETLTDGWFVIPSLPIRDGADFELDVVLLHRDYGVFDLEVKSQEVRIEEGMWRNREGLLHPQPFDQARTNSYKLRDLLRIRDPRRFGHLRVHYAVVFPNTTTIDGQLPDGMDREQILLADDLEGMSFALEALASKTYGIGLTQEDIGWLVGQLRPNVSFDYDPNTSVRRARARLDQLGYDQVHLLERLDVNKRVIATGGAGSGKTRLAMNWAKRAWYRDERVLLTCFNVPLAEQIAEYLADFEDLTVGPFLPLALSLCGLEPAGDLDSKSPQELKDYWDVTVVGLLHRHWPDIEPRFDTIIIDEAQDFSPAWIAQLESLLDPEGERRMLLVADAKQDVFGRGLRLPGVEDGWTACELVHNVRNTYQIAQILRSVLDGTPARQQGPESLGVELVDTAGQDVAEVLSKVLHEGTRRGLKPAGTTAVICDDTALRERLRNELGLGTWADRHDKIMCESVRRLKGTEFDTIILMDEYESLDTQRLYIGISRAISQLIVLGPVSLGERLGIPR
jgi:hypothetical protein